MFCSRIVLFAFLRMNREWATAQLVGDSDRYAFSLAKGAGS